MIALRNIQSRVHCDRWAAECGWAGGADALAQSLAEREALFDATPGLREWAKVMGYE